MLGYEKNYILGNFSAAQENHQNFTNDDLSEENTPCDVDDPDWRSEEDEVEQNEELADEVVESNRHENRQQQNEKSNKKRKARGKVPNPDDWEKNRSTKSRMLGKEYLGYTKINGSVKHNIQRPERKMKEGCENRSYCKKSGKRNCNIFTAAKREEIFRLFGKWIGPRKKCM